VPGGQEFESLRARHFVQSRALLQVVAKARKNRPRRALAHAHNFEPMVLVGIPSQNVVHLPVPVHVREVDRRPLRYRRSLDVSLLEWQLSQHEHVRTLIDNDDHLAEFNIGISRTHVNTPRPVTSQTQLTSRR